MSSALPVIRTVFFDMGNVLVQFSHDLLVQQLASLFHTTDSRMRQVLMDNGRLLAYERGEYSESEFIAYLEQQFQIRVNQDAFRTAFGNIFTLMPGIIPLLEKVRRTDTQLILLSNTSITHLEFIDRQFDVLSFMHDRVASFEVGAVKPDPAIYAAAVERAGCAAEECFYTDDIADYIVAATKHGINATQFVDACQLERELRRLMVLP